MPESIMPVGDTVNVEKLFKIEGGQKVRTLWFFFFFFLSFKGFMGASTGGDS